MPKTKSRQDKARENARAKDPEYDGKRALAEIESVNVKELTMLVMLTFKH